MPERSERDKDIFQSYLDNIKAKTGKTSADFRALAEKKGLTKPGVKTGEVVAWLKTEHGLGHGHAMAVVSAMAWGAAPAASKDDEIGAHFSGAKSAWRKPYDGLIAKLSKFGSDVTSSAGKSYISLLRGGKKLGILVVTAERLDVGIKLKGAPPTDRFEAAGSWNAMVTHRVRITDAKQIDAEVLGWLKRAYDAAG